MSQRASFAREKHIKVIWKKSPPSDTLSADKFQDFTSPLSHHTTHETLRKLTKSVSRVESMPVASKIRYQFCTNFPKRKLLMLLIFESHVKTFFFLVRSLANFQFRIRQNHTKQKCGGGDVISTRTYILPRGNFQCQRLSLPLDSIILRYSNITYANVPISLYRTHDSLKHISVTIKFLSGRKKGSKHEINCLSSGLKLYNFIAAHDGDGEDGKRERATMM